MSTARVITITIQAPPPGSRCTCTTDGFTSIACPYCRSHDPYAPGADVSREES